jgi:Putative prokaryotic signal transducing protein
MPGDLEHELVTIATFGTVMEAEMARGFLEANGVDVFLLDLNMTRIASAYAAMIGGIKLQVRYGDEQRARDLLSEVGSDPGSAIELV